MRILIFTASLFLLDSFLRMTLLIFRNVKSPRPDSEINQTTFGCVVLIAARDEAGTIGATVESLQRHLHEWPESSICVVADRCVDSTAEEAAAAGAQVAIRHDWRLGKGAVIAWWMQNFETVWQSKDAVLILDADSRIAPGTLRELRGAIANGAEIAQAFVSPDAETNSGRLAGWSEVLMQRIDDEARHRCGWSVPLRGTGMIFRPHLLAELAPRLHTFAEDLELDVILASQSKQVRFVSQAIVFDPKPQQSAGASRQRARWLQGQLQVLRDYPREFGKALLTGGVGAWFLLWLLMLRPKVLFIGLRVLLLISGIFFKPLLWLALIGLTMDTLYYLAGAVMVDNPRRYLLDLLATPGYLAMWSYSFGMALIRRRVWMRAGR